MKKILYVLLVFTFLYTFTFISNRTFAIDRFFEGSKIEDFGFHLVKPVPVGQVFSIKGGTLFVKGEPRGWLETKKTYRNFTLQAEVRFPQGTKVNSGIFIRINGNHLLGYSPRSVEIQMEPKSIGLLMSFYDMKMNAPDGRFSINEKHWSKVRRTVEKIRDPEIKDFTKWQKIVVLSFADTVIVAINGTIVNWATGIEEHDGRIGFQSEGGAVEYRNVVIEEF